MIPSPRKPSGVYGHSRSASVRILPSFVSPSKSSRVSRSAAASRSASASFPGSGGGKRLTFGGEWHFKDDGIATVKQRFGNRDDAVCYYDPDDFVWHILCLPKVASQVETFFLKLVRGLINEELLGGYESESDDENGDIGYDFDDPYSKGKKSEKLIRLSVWKRRNGLSETSPIYPLADPLAAVNFPEALSHFEARTFWEPGANSELMVDLLFPWDVIQQLQDLTGCIFVLDIGQNTVFMGAHYEEQCHRAIGKMDNIREYAPFNDMRNRPVRHVLYTEGHEKVRYQIKTFTGVSREFFLTTLLDNSQLCSGNDYDTLWMACTIRVAPWNYYSLPAGFELHRPQRNQVPATPIDQVEAVSRLFGPDFTFVPKTAEQNPLSHIEHLEADDASLALENLELSGNDPPYGGYDSRQASAATAVEGRVAGWITAETRADGNFTENSENYKKIDGNVSKVGSIVSKQKPAWDTYTEPEAPEQGFVPKMVWASTAPQGQLARNIAAIQQIRSVVSRSSSSGHSVTHDHLAAMTQQAPPPTTATASSTVAQPVFKQQLVPAVQPPSTSVADVEEFLNPRPEATLLDSDDISAFDRDFPVLQPVRAVRPPPRPRQSQTERRQETTEVSTRAFHRTMNQKAPRRSVDEEGARKQFNPFEGRLGLPASRKGWQGPDNSTGFTKTDGVGNMPTTPRIKHTETVVDPMPGLCTEINTEVDNIMNTVRGFRGEVLLHAEFGRTILKRLNDQQKADEDNTHLLFDKDNLLDILQPTTRYRDAVYCHPFFSRVLTTAAHDAAFLVDMNDSKGNKIWGTQLDWEIMYQFLGRNTAVLGHPQFIIEMDGEKNGFKTTIKKQRPLGEVYVHGTRRNWDFRISAVGNETLEKTYASSHQPLADGIRNTLHIPEKLTKPFLAFSLPNSLIGVDKMEIDSIRVHRISKYLSVDEKSVLKISEVTDLDATQRSAPDKGLTVFKAIAPTECRPGREKVNMWHEVNISSVAANKAIRQNQALELGEKAAWTVESLSKTNYAEALYLPAFEMLKQMDGIGYWNDNDLDPTIRPMERKVEFPVFQWW